MTLEDQLCTAAANGDAPLAEELLRAGAQVNGTNQFGRTSIQVGRCYGAPHMPHGELSTYTLQVLERRVLSLFGVS